MPLNYPSDQTTSLRIHSPFRCRCNTNKPKTTPPTILEVLLHGGQANCNRQPPLLWYINSIYLLVAHGQTDWGRPADDSKTPPAQYPPFASCQSRRNDMLSTSESCMILSYLVVPQDCRLARQNVYRTCQPPSTAVVLDEDLIPSNLTTERVSIGTRLQTQIVRTC